MDFSVESRVKPQAKCFRVSKLVKSADGGQAAWRARRCRGLTNASATAKRGGVFRVGESVAYAPALWGGLS
ncbi:MAG: hypothetical protein ACYTE3_20210 [Planctomycetota bacterium]